MRDRVPEPGFSGAHLEVSVSLENILQMHPRLWISCGQFVFEIQGMPPPPLTPRMDLSLSSAWGITQSQL